MKNFYKRIGGFTLSLRNKIRGALLAFNKKERIAFFALLCIFFVSAIVLLERMNQSFMIGIPKEGGSITEGVLGSPRFINPVLAYSQTDGDLVSLVYSGLMRKDTDGNLIPDLAEKYDISKDGLSYTFTLKKGVVFQDGKPVTADDIIFTVNKVKDWFKDNRF